MEDKNIEQLKSLEKVKAPADFVDQLHARIEKKNIWQKIFLPLHIKLPLELAGTLVTVLLVLFIYNIYQPGQPMLYKESLKAEKMAKMAVPKTTASGAGSKSKIYQEPLELALVMESASMAPATPAKSMMRERAATGMAVNMKLEDKQAETTQEDKIETIVLSVQGKVVSKINNQYIIEVPTKKYKVLLNELEELGKISAKNTPTTNQETLLIYLTIKK